MQIFGYLRHSRNALATRDDKTRDLPLSQLLKVTQIDLADLVAIGRPNFPPDEMTYIVQRIHAA